MNSNCDTFREEVRNSVFLFEPDTFLTSYARPKCLKCLIRDIQPSFIEQGNKLGLQFCEKIETARRI